MNELIEKRESPVAFSTKSVEEEKLETLFNAARWAASSFNEQPWRFIYARRENEDDFGKLFDCLTEGNKKWAENVPVLILSIAKTHFSRNDKPNRHAWHDVGQAVANMAIQATELELYMHQMAGFDQDKARKDLNIPDGYEPVAMIGVGYRTSAEELDDESLKKRENKERTRKPLEEVVFEGEWSEPVAS